MASGSAVSGADVNGFIQFRPRSGMFPRASPARERDRDSVSSLGGEKMKEFARAARASGRDGDSQLRQVRPEDTLLVDPTPRIRARIARGSGTSATATETGPGRPVGGSKLTATM